LLGGAISAMVQARVPSRPRGAPSTLIRADIAFLAIELAARPLVVNLQTSSASHRGRRADRSSGPTWAFWGVIVALGILAPLALQGLELRHRIPHTVPPALLVLVGGFALRWVMVNAGQASHAVHAAGL
jgi:formate-dependent nitrite reductase membrane component NrfD